MCWTYTHSTLLLLLLLVLLLVLLLDFSQLRPNNRRDGSTVHGWSAESRYIYAKHRRLRWQISHLRQSALHCGHKLSHIRWWSRAQRSKQQVKEGVARKEMGTKKDKRGWKRAREQEMSENNSQVNFNRYAFNIYALAAAFAVATAVTVSAGHAYKHPCDYIDAAIVCDGFGHICMIVLPIAEMDSCSHSCRSCCLLLLVYVYVRRSNYWGAQLIEYLLSLQN